MDKFIKPFMKKMNAAGLPTLASCSGLVEDHPKDKGELQPAYVCFDVSNDKLDFSGNMIDFPPQATTPRAHEIANAIEDAGWYPKFSRYMLGVPSVCAYPQINPGDLGWHIYGIGVFDAIDHPEKYPKELETAKKIDNCLKTWREALTDDVLKKKWNNLETKMLKLNEVI